MQSHGTQYSTLSCLSDTFNSPQHSPGTDSSRHLTVLHVVPAENKYN